MECSHLHTKRIAVARRFDQRIANPEQASVQISCSAWCQRLRECPYPSDRGRAGLSPTSGLAQQGNGKTVFRHTFTRAETSSNGCLAVSRSFEGLSCPMPPEGCFVQDMRPCLVFPWRRRSLLRLLLAGCLRWGPEGGAYSVINSDLTGFKGSSRVVQRRPCIGAEA